MPVRPNSRAMKPISSEKLSPARFDASGAQEEKAAFWDCRFTCLKEESGMTGRRYEPTDFKWL